MKYIFLFFIVVNLFSSTLYVAVSSNVAIALKDIVKEFKKKYPNIKVKMIISSSGKLTAQIINKAPYDIFLSANMQYPKFLYKKGLAINKPKVYARGAISLFSVKIKHPSLEDLLKVKEIAIANPKFAPYGKASIEVLENKHILQKVKNKLIYAETISSVIPYVLNSAEIGIIAKSLIYSLKIRNLKYYVGDIDKNLYTPISQGVVILNNKNETIQFFNFLFSKKAKEIFIKYGYY